MKFDWLVDMFKNISAIAIIAGGLWSLYHYWRGRIFKSRLSIDVKTISESLNNEKVLFVEIILTNSGKSKIAARQISHNDYAYQDEFEKLKYSCSLQVKRVNMNKILTEAYLDWFKSDGLEAVPNIPAEINLLNDYILPNENNKLAFWMEPGDVVHLSAPLVLEPGHYILKVAFYGPNPDEDYWSRLVYVRL